MRIIISPAKKMNTDTDSFPCRNLPEFLEETQELLSYMMTWHYGHAQSIWHCSSATGWISDLMRIGLKKITLYL